MKKLIIISIILLGSVFLYTESKAQASWELSIRYGDRGSVEGTIPVGIAPRIKPSIFFTDRFGLAGYLNWMFSLNDGPSGLKFFPGVGTEFYLVDP